jgi:DNA invertase Pin-like site-specific DNA recombinase
MVAEFESDLIRAHTREGKRVAKAKGRPPATTQLTKSQEAHLVSLYNGGHHTTTEIAELFKVARSTVYRIVHRTPPARDKFGGLPPPKLPAFHRDPFDAILASPDWLDKLHP